MSIKSHYIITGPPSSGKTSIINHLENLGYWCFPEIARRVIKENRMSNLNCFPWNNMKEFSNQVFRRNVELLTTVNDNSLCFFDRSAVDVIAYMDVSNIKRNTSFNNEVSELSYNKMVFFMPFWSQIYQNDNERIETKNQAIKIENQLRIVYLEFGFELVDVPKLNISERVNFILKRVQKNN